MSVTQDELSKQPSYDYHGIKIQVIPVSPAVNETPVQIACFPDRTLNMTMEGGSLDLDTHFSGAIRSLREADHFRGERYETLLIAPRNQQVPAGKVLLFGLGDPDTLAFEHLEVIGRMIVREAIKLGTDVISFAPDIKDAGMTHLAGGQVSTSVVTGICQAIDAQKAMESQSLAGPLSLEHIILLAGAAHLETSQAGVQAALDG